MTNTMDRLLELGERMVARSQHCENTKDAIAMQEHAAELDAILAQSETERAMHVEALREVAELVGDATIDARDRWSVEFDTRGLIAFADAVLRGLAAKPQGEDGKAVATPEGVALNTGHGKVLGEMMARIFGSGDKVLTEQESREIRALHAAQVALAATPPAGDGARVTDIMVREALAHCPFDLTPPARWAWLADKLNAYMADPSQIDRDDAESAARVAALMAAGETSDAAREGGAS